MSKSKKIIVTILCMLFIVLGTGYFLGLAYFQTHFKIGTTINGFHCSFKSLNDTEELLSREVESYAIAVNTRNNGIEKISASDVGLKFNGKANLIELLKTQDYRLWFIPSSEEVTLPEDCYEIDSSKLTDELRKLKCMNNMVPSESAHIVETNGFYQVAAAVKGTFLDKNKARQIIETAIRQWRPSVNLEEADCYIDVDSGDEKELQKHCDFLNSIQDTIITYDFGDRTESVDFAKIKKHFLDSNFRFNTSKMKKYIEKIAEKYDTVGIARNFVTYDNRTANISGGDYGWKLDVDKTTKSLIDYIKKDTIDVVSPVYTQTAASRQQNDVGYSYLEIDMSNSHAVLYIDGTPVVQTSIKTNGDINPGFYKISGKQEMDVDGLMNTIDFGEYKIYQYNPVDVAASFSGSDDISGFSSNGVNPNSIAIDDASMVAIFNSMQNEWPVIVYSNDNISGQIG